MADAPTPLPDFAWPEASTPDDEQVLADVREHSTYIASAAEVPKKPSFAYTVGLYLNYGHPEMLLLGLPPEVATDVLDSIQDLVAGGAVFAAGESSDDVLRKFPVRFSAVPDAERDARMPRATWFYGAHTDGAFPCLQVLWPAGNGRFPGQKGSPMWMRKRQPILQPAD
ncbi:MAG: DUF4262 domain-containing protein [Deltaproteobacteria bacterium]|nr:DUF4262 domain-containing protein [Deltaproteobacteria bacterium]